MIVRLAPLLVAAAGLLASGCATQRADPATDQAHSRQTLQFFGVRPDMTVVEVWPGGGSDTEILAPLLRNHGRLYVANLDPAGGEYARRTVDDFQAKLTTQPDLYDKVVVTTLAAPPASNAIAPPGSADLVVTDRNLHNWMMFGWQREAFEAMHAALKPGGVLGVVDHRGDARRPQDPKAASGYVHEQYAIDLIESVGFKLVARSEVNANPRDTKNYEKGVWALPPTFAGGAVNRERFAAIGESDRFTLKFVKVSR